MKIFVIKFELVVDEVEKAASRYIMSSTHILVTLRRII